MQLRSDTSQHGTAQPLQDMLQAPLFASASALQQQLGVLQQLTSLNPAWLTALSKDSRTPGLAASVVLTTSVILIALHRGGKAGSMTPSCGMHCCRNNLLSASSSSSTGRGEASLALDARAAHPLCGLR